MYKRDFATWFNCHVYHNKNTWQWTSRNLKKIKSNSFHWPDIYYSMRVNDCLDQSSEKWNVCTHALKVTIKRPNIPRTIRKIYAHSVHSFTPTSTISGRLSRAARATAVDSRVDRDMSFGCVRITNLLLVLWLSFT